MLHAINWVEIPVIDFERAKLFYSAIYDYEMTERIVGEDRYGFLIFNREQKGVGGAIVKGKDFQPTTHGIKAYLTAGNDLDIVLNRVENAGGKVILPKTLIAPDIGYYATFQDTEGNNISLFSPN